ncbi:MAG: asparagine synthase C-terminal domain-containing protein, partial [Cyclobacteriaceae bacterium]
AVYILSKETRKHATVALSGDGADELLGGYNKHEAMYRMLHPGFKENFVSSLGFLWRSLPHSRNNPLVNKFRQLDRFAKGMKLDAKERYWQLAGFASESESLSLLSSSSREKFEKQIFENRKNEILKTISFEGSINSVLLTDMKTVLPNDMLTKVDLMSMANSLEVRVPFLDHELVNFVSGLPDDFKINSKGRKRVAQDAFREMLPAKLYNMPKKGFEVPLLKWFRNEMKSMITDDLLSKSFIEEQNIFDYTEIEKLKKQLFSSNPGDVHARIWGLTVFQWWWKKNCK